MVFSPPKSPTWSNEQTNVAVAVAAVSRRLARAGIIAH